MIGETVRLRALEKSDAQILFLWENDPENWQYGTLSAPWSHFQIEQYVETASNDIFESKQLRLIIENQSTSQPIGVIDLFDFDVKNRRAGVGILVQKGARRQGFGFEALQLLVRYCFEELSMHQLWCNILEDNEFSIQLFKKSGFQLVGVKKDWVFRHHRWKNELMFQLVNNEL